MRFAIAGATGLVGTELTKQLRAEGHTVTRITRSREKARAPGTVRWSPSTGEVDEAALAGHEVVVNLAGEPIAGIWTKERKRRILSSRVDGTRLLAQTIVRLDPRPRAYFVSSGMNYYGARPTDEPKTEAAPKGDGFLADVTHAWEAAADPARDAGIRVVHMRCGHVLDGSGGLLGPMLPFFKLGLGGWIGDGRQVWSWIANPELPRALLHVLARDEITGAVNFCTPNPVPNREFSETLARVLNRPAFLFLPEFAARLAPGGMGEEALLAGVRMAPAKLVASGYDFRWPELEGALREVIGK